MDFSSHELFQAGLAWGCLWPRVSCPLLGTRHILPVVVSKVGLHVFRRFFLLAVTNFRETVDNPCSKQDDLDMTKMSHCAGLDVTFIEKE
jgi:hypothetical protein